MNWFRQYQTVWGKRQHSLYTAADFVQNDCDMHLAGKRKISLLLHLVHLIGRFVKGASSNSFASIPDCRNWRSCHQTADVHPQLFLWGHREALLAKTALRVKLTKTSGKIRLVKLLVALKHTGDAFIRYKTEAQKHVCEEINTDGGTKTQETTIHLRESKVHLTLERNLPKLIVGLIISEQTLALKPTIHRTTKYSD